MKDSTRELLDDAGEIATSVGRQLKSKKERSMKDFDDLSSTLADLSTVVRKARNIEFDT